MGDILGKGWKLLLIDIIVIIFSISLTLILNQIIKGNQDISILLGIGTGYVELQLLQLHHQS